MFTNIEKKKAVSPHKAQEDKRISRFIKVLKSFDRQHRINRQKASKARLSNQKSTIQNQLSINLPTQKYTSPSNYTPERYQSIARHHDDLSTISKSSKFSGQKVSLPSMSLDIYFPQKVEKKNQPNYTLSNNRIKTEASTNGKLPKIFFNKVEGSHTGNLLEFLRLKPTEKYFSKKQNLRIAQKLLLASPSKGLQRCEHQKFYNEQKSYRTISQNSLKISHEIPSIQRKRKQHKHSKSLWVN